MDASTAERHIPWNKGKLTGQKPPLRLRETWRIRIRLQLAGDTRDLALFNLAIDSKLRGCDLVRLRVPDVSHQGGVMHRAAIVQRKTGRLVQFELTEQTRQSVAAWLRRASRTAPDYLFPSQR
jgi:integrase